MRFVSRYALVVALVIAASPVGTLAATAAEPDLAKVNRLVMANGVGGHVKLVLVDHSRVDGRIARYDDHSVDIALKGQTETRSVALAEVCP